MEITSPFCLSGQHQVIESRRRATGFDFCPGQEILSGWGLKSFLSKDYYSDKYLALSIVVEQMLQQAVTEINCENLSHGGAKRNRCGQQILLDNIQD